MLSGWYFPDSIGGTEAYVESLCRELVKLNYDVEVAIPSIKNDYFYENIKVNCYKPNADYNIEVLRGKKEPDNIDSFIKLIKRTNPDIVHIHTVITDCSLFHINELKKMNITLILTLHVPGVMCPRGTFLQWGKAPCDRKLEIYKCAACVLNQRGIPKFLTNPLLKLQTKNTNSIVNVKYLGFLFNTKNYIKEWISNMRELISSVDQVVVLSKWQQEAVEINKIKYKKLILSNHGIEKKNFLKHKEIKLFKEKVITFGYIGRIDYIKGIHVLINSFLKISAENIKLKIYGIANTKEENKYYEYLRKLAGDDIRILFEGPLNSANRSEKMKDIDVLVIPSIWYETGPLVLLEAFNFKIPIIGSDLGGISEKIVDGYTGYLYEVGNINKLKETLQKIIDKPDLIKILSDNINYNKYTEDVAQEMSNLYKDHLN